MDIPAWCDTKAFMPTAYLQNAFDSCRRNASGSNKVLRQWFGVLQSFSSLGSYSTGIRLQLPIRSVVEEFKVTKVRQQITLNERRDKVISGARIRVRSRRKSNACEMLEEAESS
jgi:hypothetical protein